ncbi:MAG: amidase [Thermodesulfobacteriota bacterium]
MSGSELCFLTLAGQASLVRRREVSPVEVLASVLRQIERLDRRVKAYITVMSDSALAAAQAAEHEIAQGHYRGPLHGLPLALKDLIHTEGVRTTAGSKIMRDFIPGEDATAVTRLKQAGAVILGKTNMHEFAYGSTNVNPHYGTVRNPWNDQVLPGGSSGGSAAAVAASMCSAALGSDTGGSIRMPAAFCGITGFKPTYGRVSRHGVVPCAWSMDHVGPLAKTAEDAALVLAAIAGWDPKDPASSREPVQDYMAQLEQDVAGLRVGVLREYTVDPVMPEVEAAFRRALGVLRELGLKVEEISIPETKYAVGASNAILLTEAASYHEERLRSRAGDYGEDVRSRLELGLFVSATDYVKAQRVRRLLIEKFQNVLRRYEAIVCATEPITAPGFDQEVILFDGLAEPRSQALVRHLRLFSLIGLPAVSLLCGFASDGLPIGLQIAAAPFADGRVLQIAAAYQKSAPWHLQAPPAAKSQS